MNYLTKSANGIAQVNADAKLLADRKILLYWDIDAKAACMCMQQILLLNMGNSKPITLLINSNGGDIGAGLLIYDAIKGSKAPVKTICTGRAYSMAAILLAAGTGGRYILPHSEVMIHEPVITEVAGNVITVEALSGRLREAKDARSQTLEECAPDHFAIRCWRSFRSCPIKTAGCIYSSLSVSLDHLFPPAARTLFTINWSVDLMKIAQEKTVLFLVTSPVNPAMHGLVNIFYSQLFRILFEAAEARPDGTLPVPVHVLCDDFATGGRILNFPEYISIFREKGISVTILLQSESQLEAMYGPQNTTTIINNCDSYVYMGGMDLKTAQSVSLRANLPLEDILYMPIGQEIIFRRGQRPIVAQRYNIMADERYQEIAHSYSLRTRAKQAKREIFEEIIRKSEEKSEEFEEKAEKT